MNNDYQEAIEHIDRNLLDNFSKPIVLEALEKQIVKEAKMGNSRDTLHRISFCPVCGSLVWKSRYCFNCGQRLRAD